MKSFKLIIGIIVIALLFVFIFVFTIKASGQYTIDTSEYTTEAHVVKSGETLWNLGKKYCGEDDDIRAWIMAVKKLNNCKSALYAGQTLEIYIAK